MLRVRRASAVEIINEEFIPLLNEIKVTINLNDANGSENRQLDLSY